MNVPSGVCVRCGRVCSWPINPSGACSWCMGLDRQGDSDPGNRKRRPPRPISVPWDEEEQHGA